MTRAIIQLLVVGALLAASGARASFSNGNFSGGLADWSTSGDVTTFAGAAVLGDNGAIVSILFQPVPWPDASFTLELDFQSNQSDTFAQGSFPDAFFASLYYVEDPNTFDPDNNGYTSVVGLFDLDAAGPYNSMGTITPSGLGGDWSHFSITLPNTSGYIIPYFEAHDLNGQTADSNVMIDNVQLVVPEPTTLGLAAMGGLALAAMRRRRRRDMLAGRLRSTEVRRPA